MYRGGSHLLAALAVIFIALVTTVSSGAEPLVVKVTVTPIDFGPLYAVGTFTGFATAAVTAPVGLNFRLAVDRGFHFFGGFRHLKRSAGAELIPYRLYRDTACTLAVGDDGSGDMFPAGKSREQLITIYGRLTVPASAPPGLYQDSIMISVIY
jgi:spore coat protein U-like protein